MYYHFLVLDHIIGCGERNGRKYFLVRFKGASQNELIDWEAAKAYSLQVMEYFGSRLVWSSIENIIDPENDDNVDYDDDLDDDHDKQMASTSEQSRQNPLPNEIEYEN